jgi:septal ring factor EnvC (AmiA/AmiB activator)
VLFSLITRVRDDAVGFLGIAPRALARGLEDIREISEQMQRMVEMVSHLPELNQHLASIDAQVAELQREVAQMRSGVEKINSQVDDLNETLMAELREVTLAVHPLRRTTARFRRTGRAAKPDADSS